jgi:hypothetical protein
MSERGAPSLSAPDAVSLSVRLRLAGRAALPAQKIAVHNASDEPVVIERVGCDPLQDAASGTAAEGRLPAALLYPTAGAPLPPGETAIVEISGDAPARAGSYASKLRVRIAGGETLVVPISLQVGASPLRGIAAMAAGLVLVGVVNFLAGEAAVKKKLHEVLDRRQAANELLERNPPPESQSLNLDAYDRDIGRAVQDLTAGRSWSLFDYRIADAAEDERVAAGELKEIRDAIAGTPDGAGEVAELDREWRGLQQRLTELATPSETTAGQGSDGLAGRVGAFLARFKRDLLDLPMRIDSAGLGAQVARVDLLLSAGERDAADRRASEVRRWLQRDARDLEARVALVEGMEVLASSLLVEDARDRQDLGDPALADTTRQTLSAALDRAAAGLSGRSAPREFGEAYGRLLAVGTQILKARSDAVVADVEAVVQKEAAATSLAAVDAAMADNPPKKGSPLPVRVAFLRRVLAAWSEPLAHADPSTYGELKARIAAIDAALARGDLEATSGLYHGLLGAWSDYGVKRLAGAVLAVSADYCRTAGSELRSRLAVTELNMQLVPDHQNLPGWEKTLDRLRLEVDSIPMEACMAPAMHRENGAFAVSLDQASPFFGLSAAALDLDRQVFAAGISRVSISAADLSRAAQSSGNPEAMKFARRLLRHPRPLTIEAITAPADRYAGRPIAFRVDGLDEGWGPGVEIALDFGDGSAVAATSAEEAREQPFVHSYREPTAPRLQVAAAFAFRPGTLSPVDRLLGSGGANYKIDKSPQTAARAIGDIFLNLRFGLALLIAVLVYFWQFWAREPTFGAQSFDYVKAFALGVAVQAAVSNLPEALGKIALG